MISGLRKLSEKCCLTRVCSKKGQVPIKPLENDLREAKFQGLAPLLVKSNIAGRFYFQVDDEVVRAY